MTKVPFVPDGVDEPMEEKLIWEGCPKWQADFGFILLSFLVMTIGFAILGLLLMKTSWVWFIRILFPLLISLTGFIMFVGVRLKRKNERYKITNLNIEYEFGVFSKTVHNLEMWRIRDISFLQTFFDRIVKISRVNLQTSDPTSPELIMEGLPPGRRIYDDVKQAYIMARQRKNIVGIVE
jgi:uncharacterized membrane protein YdbT with pleckstrin-like domain